MKNTWIKRAATLGLMAGMLSVPLAVMAAEEMTIETPKVYTPATVNGVQGFWVEYQKKTYRKVAKVINTGKVGWFDQSLQDLYTQLLGLDRPLTAAELQQLYAQYGIPTGFSTNRDYGNGLHDFKFDQVEARIKAQIAQYSKLVQADTVDDILDALGPQGVDSAMNGLIADVSQRWYGAGNTTGAAYIWNASDGVHTLSYYHGGGTANYKTADLDAAAWSRNASKSVRDMLLNRTSDFRILGDQASSVNSFANAARFWFLSQAPFPLAGTLDAKVLGVNGPIQMTEPAGNKARLADIARFLYSTVWETHSPVALDLNGDGKIGVTGTSTAQRRMQGSQFVAKNSVWFDITASGKKMNIEWLDKSGDGFLVDDSHGRLSKALAKGGELDGSFLFGDSIGYLHGYHKLAIKKNQINIASTAQLDETTVWPNLLKQKPVLKGNVLNTMKVWVDKNGDAKLQQGELHTLASLGVSEIGAAPETKKNAKGEYVIQSYFVKNGKKMMTEDVWFAENPETMGK